MNNTMNITMNFPAYFKGAVVITQQVDLQDAVSAISSRSAAAALPQVSRSH